MIKHSPLLAAVVCCASSLSLATSATAQSEPAWLIVEVAPLSGPASTVGTRLNRSAKMWADEINNRGGIRGARFVWSHATTRGAPRRQSAARATPYATGPRLCSLTA